MSESCRPLSILLVEDNPNDVELCLRALKRSGIEANSQVVQTAHEFCAAITARDFDIVLTDHGLPGFSVLETLELLQQLEKDIPVIILTGGLPDEQVAEYLDKGAADFVDKGNMNRLPTAIRRTLELMTARKRAADLERQLAGIEESCARLAELSADPHLIESDGAIVYANAPAARLLGAPSEHQLRGKPAAQIWHADSRNSLGQAFAELLTSRAPVSCDARLLRLDGKAVDVKIAATAIIYHGRPSVHITIRDLSGRRRVDAAIKSLSALAESNPYPVFECSRDGKLAYANAPAAELACALGKDNASAILPPESALIVQTCLSTGQKRCDVETTCGGRTLVWDFLPAQQNQVVHVYARDATERQNLEAQLRHAQRLEATGRLATGIAHDFSNILTIIQGHAGLLRAEPNLSHAMRESLQQVVRATQRAAKLTDHLLAFTRKTGMDRQPLDLNQVLADLSALLHRAIGEDIEFEFNYDTNLPAILADRRLIEQCVLNTAINARDTMPAGGQLLVSTSVAEINAAHTAHHPEARAGRFVCLSIVDSGAAVNASHLAAPHEPFSAENPGGNGLSLATVSSIVKQHQGWIELQSCAGQGTAFRFYFPVHTGGSERAKTHKTDRSGAANGETVLLVEDEAPVRAIIRTLLERKGFEVLEAASGIEALALWHQHHAEIRLLLTDVVMPAGLSGPELAEKFRAQKPDLKVLYTSGYTPEAAGPGISEDENSTFLQKPFDALKLADIVRRCLDQ